VRGLAYEQEEDEDEQEELEKGETDCPYCVRVSYLRERLL